MVLEQLDILMQEKKNTQFIPLQNLVQIGYKPKCKT